MRGGGGTSLTEAAKLLLAQQLMTRGAGPWQTTRLLWCRGSQHVLHFPLHKVLMFGECLARSVKRYDTSGEKKVIFLMGANPIKVVEDTRGKLNMSVFYTVYFL